MPRINPLVPAALLVLALSVSCASPRKQAPEPRVAQVEAPPPQPLPPLPCPLELDGVAVSAAESGGGIAIAFTAAGDLTELHRRVEAFAERHNLLQDPQGPAWTAEGAGALITLPGTRARVDLLEDGVALVFLPGKPEELDVLRAQVNRRVALMQQTGTCTERSQPRQL